MTDTKLVPVEPTEAMWSAAERAFDRDPDTHHETVLANVWSAMLAAAPVVGEPVAWRYRFITSIDGKEWSDWFIVDDLSSVPSRPDQTVEPLYTHYNPKLDVAVKALE